MNNFLKNIDQIKSLKIKQKNYFLVVFIMISLQVIFSNSYGNTPNNQTSSFLSLTIQVKTNVDHFKCDYKSPLTENFKLNTDPLNSEINSDGIKLVVPVKKISCINKIMENDLQEMLKSEIYPYVTVDIGQFSIPVSNKGITTAEVEIGITGTKNKYRIAISNTQVSDNIYLCGRFNINLMDFNIIPPTKLFGLIVVDQIIEVNFIITYHDLERNNKTLTKANQNQK